MNEKEIMDKAIANGSLMSDNERECLWNLAKKHIPQNGLAIEIGTWRGGSSAIIGEICKQKQARLICIDLFNGDMHGRKNYLSVSPNMLFRTARNLSSFPINYITGESQNIVNILANNIADFIFVDGRHHLPVVKDDIEGFWYKLKSGGLYCGHDYEIKGKCDVKSVVDNFFGDGKIKVVDTLWYVLKNDAS